MCKLHFCRSSAGFTWCLVENPTTSLWFRIYDLRNEMTLLPASHNFTNWIPSWSWGLRIVLRFHNSSLGFVKQSHHPSIHAFMHMAYALCMLYAVDVRGFCFTFFHPPSHNPICICIPIPFSLSVLYVCTCAWYIWHLHITCACMVYTCLCRYIIQRQLLLSSNNQHILLIQIPKSQHSIIIYHPKLQPRPNSTANV